MSPWSYHSLSPSAARLFRLLALHDGPELGLGAASSLVGVPAGPLLAELTAASLVVEPAPGRYRLNDLAREYGQELGREFDSPDEQREARHRLLDHYLHTALVAYGLTEPHLEPLAPDPVRPETFPTELADDLAALDWFTAERSNLLAAIRMAAAAGFHRHTWRLAYAVEADLARDGLWHEQLAAHELAVAAADRLDDPAAEAHAVRGLGSACIWLGRYEEAHAYFDRAARLFAAVGDALGEGRIHSRLGQLLGRQGRHHEAVAHKRRALELFRAVGRPAGEARMLNQLGWSLIAVGEHQQAARTCLQAIALARSVGDRQGEALARDSLALAYHHLDRYDEAAAGFDRALATHRQMGDRFHEAETLVHLGQTLAATRRIDDARDAWQQALEVLHELAHPDAEAVAARLEELTRTHSDPPAPPPVPLVR